MFGRSRLARVREGQRASAPAPEPAAGERLQRMFVAHHAMVWRTLRRSGLSADAAGDATQQAFLIAAERLADIQADSERAFLVGTALRVARTLWRKTMRWQLEEDMDRRVVETRDHDDARASVQLCDIALSKIDPDVAEVFVLFEIEGLSSPEIAASLEIPLGTVASRLRRAREQFRRVVGRIETTIEREGAA
ncbi:MAG TPA: sigma-70 family RNA polymerase sigma factor [Polyangia bacterium]|nr:sigma-70 family RNA polymerase sigma factor [Polyangia bacterium]